MSQTNGIDPVQLIEAHTTFAPRTTNQPAPPPDANQHTTWAQQRQAAFAAGLGLRGAVA